MNDPDEYCGQFLHGPKLLGYCSPVDTLTTEDQGQIEGASMSPFKSMAKAMGFLVFSLHVL